MIKRQYTTVAVEFDGLMKSGGLADVLAGLTAALAEDGVDVNVILPMNQQLWRSVGKKNLWLSHRSGDTLPIQLGSGIYTFDVLTAPLDHGTTLSVLANKRFANTERPVYPIQTNDKKKAYDDNLDYGLGYLAFSKAAATLIARDRPQSFVQLHDYHTAATAAFLKRLMDVRIATLLTLHNIGYGERGDGVQGVYPSSHLWWAGLGDAVWGPNGDPNCSAEYESERDSSHRITKELINLLKLGVIECDALSAVSPQYAQEIRRAPFGAGLGGLFDHYAWKLEGVMNRMDLSNVLFGCEEGPYIVPYAPDSAVEGKKQNAIRLDELCKVNGLGELDLSRPIVGAIGRLGVQKFDILLAQNGVDATGKPRYHIEDLLKTGVNVVIIGNNDNKDDKYSQALRQLSRDYKNLKWFNNHSQNGNIVKDVAGNAMGMNEHAQVLYCAAELHLCASRYEPCGLADVIGTNTGMIPVATPTGGLQKIRDYGKDARPTGFLSREVTPESFYGRVFEALKVIENPEVVRELRTNGRELVQPWSAALPEYYAIFDKALRHAGLLKAGEHCWSE